MSTGPGSSAPHHPAVASSNGQVPRRSLARLLWLAGLALLLAGCSDGLPARFPVSGTVQFRDGEPVRTGTIEFSVPGSRWTASSPIGRDGTFRLSTVKPGDGAVEGQHSIVIRQLVLAYQPAVGGHNHGRLVNARYGDYSTTDLRIDIKPGDNQIVVEVDP